MLPKKRRLTRQQFWQVNQTGAAINFESFALKYLPNTLNTSRFGVITSAKLDKRATVRNSLRRRIYKAVEVWQLGFDLIIFPKKSMINLSDAKISLELNSGLSKIS